MLCLHNETHELNKTRIKEAKEGATAYWELTKDNNCKHGHDRQSICWNEARVQHLLKDISMIYALVCATFFFFCCRRRAEELERILRTLIAQGSEKSFCCISYFQICVKVKLPLSHTHAWMLLLGFFFASVLKITLSSVLFCLFSVLPSAPMLWLCVLRFHRTQNDLSSTRVHW